MKHLLAIIRNIKMKVTFFNNINIDIPYKAIYSRLGYRKSTTEISKEQEKKIIGVINNYFKFIKLHGAIVRLSILNKDEKRVDFDSFSVESKDFAKFLKESNEVFLIGTTAGKDIVELRNSLMDSDSYSAVIIDAVGSESVESFTEWINDYLAKMISREGKILTNRRYSPGYGDFPLKYQKQVVEILQLEKIGISLSDTFILNPEKSVTAFIGVI
ncbi:MAG TPA: vitamin B12 dependent-methionine synthase activation domain-containing protein [Spirochaetota bacterium]|nr:vitamin B12 dependent-methionine synthase activation domain-containing protein [Spirochaetota bacterium]